MDFNNRGILTAVIKTELRGIEAVIFGGFRGGSCPGEMYNATYLINRLTRGVETQVSF